MSEEQAAYQTTEPEAYVLLQDWPLYFHDASLALLNEGKVFKKVAGTDFYVNDETGCKVARFVAYSFPKWFKPQYDADS